jgi:ribosomal protein S18 acetylase RimI-like enzyme
VAVISFRFWEQNYSFNSYVSQDTKYACAMTSQGDFDSSPAPNKSNASVQNDTLSSSSYHIKVFPRRDLLSQPFLPDLRTVINASYRGHDIDPIGKVGDRVQHDNQVADEIGTNGFTAVAFDLNEIVGTASVKDWVSDADGLVWKPDGYFATKSIDEACSMHNIGSNTIDTISDPASCDGDFEIFMVAVKPGDKYRKKGIAERLVKACEQELQKRFTPNLAQLAETSYFRIMIKVVREINGEYWLKKGFQIKGECCCPAFTWDLEKPFILWAMKKHLFIDRAAQ